jgi:hypothetical protein
MESCLKHVECNSKINKLDIPVHLAGFTIGIILQCMTLWTSKILLKLTDTQIFFMEIKGNLTKVTKYLKSYSHFQEHNYCISCQIHEIVKEFSDFFPWLLVHWNTKTKGHCTPSSMLALYINLKRFCSLKRITLLTNSQTVKTAYQRKQLYSYNVEDISFSF